MPIFRCIILHVLASTGFCKLVVSCKMQMQSSLVSYSNNRVIRWVWNNANLIYLISGFSILHLQTDNQLAKHCSSKGYVVA